MTKQMIVTAARAAARGKKGRADGVLLAVYAPLGTDETLSRYPNSDPNAPIAPIEEQALVRSLQATAAEGVNVCAMVDIFDDDTYVVEIPAFRPNAMRVVSVWKQDMSDHHALSHFLRHASQRFPCDALILAVEGHGGGFLPDIDYARITPENISRMEVDGTERRVRWIFDERLITVEDAPPPSSRAMIDPALGNARAAATREPDDDPTPNAMVDPALAMVDPALPPGRQPMSTWAYGEALRQAVKAGVPKPIIIHFNNCFNASVELLHTVAPYAGYATGYANYDFFLAGKAYPKVFNNLRLAGTATVEQLAKWFALETGKIFDAKNNHPIIAGTLRLSRMKTVVAAIDALALALTNALRSSGGAAARARIKAAAIAAQHYDTEPGYELKVPDQFVDIASFAIAIQAQFGPGPVDAAAAALQAALANIWQFGDKDWPWMAHNPAIVYDFSDKRLGLNIFFPDPALDGKWDWRSPYYLSGTVDPKKPPAHRHVIPFLANLREQRPRWVEFIIEYHKETKFIGFFPARAPFFPIFDAKFDPKDDTGGDNPPGTPGGPNGPGKPTTGGPKR